MKLEDLQRRVSNEVLYRTDQARLEVAESGKPWSFDGDGKLFRLVVEAHRIRLAHLFDPKEGTCTPPIARASSGPRVHRLRQGSSGRAQVLA